MLSKSYEGWVAFYEKKTGEKVERGTGYATFFFPDRGFCEIQATQDMVIIGRLCGDGKFWRQVAEVMAIERGYHHLGARTCRRIKPYIRFWGFDIERVEITEDGRERYFCRDKETGKEGIASPATETTGRQVYLITWEV